jgi:hypothetical protein
VNVRPGRVATDGQISDASDASVQLGGLADASVGLLVPVELLNYVAGSPSSVVIGSDTYAGQIVVAEQIDAPWNLTLQNTLGGIQINQPINMGAGKTLALVSGGLVSQDAPLTGSGLVMRGFGTGANFVLRNPQNAFRRIAACATKVGGGCDAKGSSSYAGGGSIDYVGTGVNGTLNGVHSMAVDLSPILWSGVSAPSDAFTTSNIPHFGAGSYFSILVTAGDLLLDPDITTASGDIDLSAPTGIFNNFANGALEPGGGGRFQVTAATWEGETRGGITGANQYACGGGACAATQNSFVYVAQPTATVFLDQVALPFGAPIAGSVSYRVAGLVNGDTPSAIFGSTPASYDLASSGIGPVAAPGTYAVAFQPPQSPTGYNVVAVPGQIVVTPPPPPVEVTENLAESPAGSLSLPQVCASIAPAMVAYSSNSAGDALDQQWTQVRQRLFVTSCTGLRVGDACSDF